MTGRESPLAARELILAMESPLAQRFAFAHLVLGEASWPDAFHIAAAFQHVGPMDEAEYDLIVERWAA